MRRQGNCRQPDLITSHHLSEILAGDFGRPASLPAACRRTLEQFGIEALGDPVRVGGRPIRLSVLRNKPRWKTASADEIRDELSKATPDLDGARDYLESMAAR